MAGKKVQITMLNSMAAQDFQESLDTQKAWGVKLLDLKDSIFGKGLMDLSMDETKKVKEMSLARDMDIYCLSSTLFFEDIEAGEEVFRTNHLNRLPEIIEKADMLQPHYIRLLSAWSSKRAQFNNSIDYMKKNTPWVFDLYRKAIDMIGQAGYHAGLENEVHDNIFTVPEEILGFFSELDWNDKVSLIWDVQNLWQSGTFPTMEVYQKLKPLIGYYHVKGGTSEEGTDRLRWATLFEDASWPVTQMTQQVVDDGSAEVICLNPSHGESKPDYDYDNSAKRDLDFLRENIKGVE